MRYAVFSDVHGNIDKLSKFFKECSNYSVENYIFLGDIIHNGENYQENRCVDLVREKDCIAVKGNHDIINIKNKLTPENTKYLLKLPKLIGLGDLIIFHDTLVSEFYKSWNPERAKKEFQGLANYSGHIGLCGNSHYPFTYLRRDKSSIEKLDLSLIRLLNNSNYFINPGALINSDYGVLDLENNEFVFLKLGN